MNPKYMEPVDRRLRGCLRQSPLSQAHDRVSGTHRQILKANGVDPALERTEVTWSQFPHSQAAVACDFFTIDTAVLRRFYVLFFIHIPSREAFLAGVTANPTGAWTTQAARNLFLRLDRLPASARALVRDRGSQFVDAFDEVRRTEGFKILKTPVRIPVANSFAERWIGSIRRELLDRTIIWNQRQLQRLVIEYIDLYNTHRPHRSLDQRPPRQDIPHEPPGHSPLPLQVIRTTCAATASSTNTKTPHDQPRRNIGHPHRTRSDWMSPAAA